MGPEPPEASDGGGGKSSLLAAFVLRLVSASFGIHIGTDGCSEGGGGAAISTSEGSVPP